VRGSVWVVVRSILVEAVVVSVDGLLDAHEVSVRARLEALREQAARVAVELGEAELALEHVAITRATLARARVRRSSTACAALGYRGARCPARHWCRCGASI
jgi:hypothetical protein